MLEVKNLPANAQDIRDAGLTSGSGRFPGEGNGYLLQYSCLENSMDRGLWRATIHRVAKSWTQLSDFYTPMPIVGVYIVYHFLPFYFL